MPPVSYLDVRSLSQLNPGCAEGKDNLEKLDAKRRMLEARISKSSETAATRMHRASRDERRSVLRCAEVVVATLSAAGGDLPCLLAASGRGASKNSALRFDAVIIDEAAQAVEPATLIPMHLLDPVKVCTRYSAGRLRTLHMRRAAASRHTTEGASLCVQQRWATAERNSRDGDAGAAGAGGRSAAAAADGAVEGSLCRAVTEPV